jgi:phosphoglycolate phosphatase
MNLKLVILDADGVLFESAESNTAYYNAIFQRLGQPRLSPEEERAGVFSSAAGMFESRAHGDPELLRRMHEVARSLDYAPFFGLLRVPFELRPFIVGLKKDYRLGLATNRGITVPALLEHLGLTGLFDAIASAQDHVRPKPAPDILQLCLCRAATVPRAAVYVGDSAIDLEAAHAAGTHFVAVGPRLDHSRHLKSLAELPSALAQLSRELFRS